jgi:hypothetical protein
MELVTGNLIEVQTMINSNTARLQPVLQMFCCPQTNTTESRHISWPILLTVATYNGAVPLCARVNINVTVSMSPSNKSVTVARGRPESTLQ